MFTVKIKIKSSQNILLKRSLNQDGNAQIKLIKLCAKEMNNYVPFDTGRLKDMSVELGSDFVKYNTPYAKKQYYTNKGKGLKNKAGLRGKLWDKRMWTSKGNAIVKEISKFVGGKSKWLLSKL